MLFVGRQSWIELLRSSDQVCELLETAERGGGPDIVITVMDGDQLVAAVNAARLDLYFSLRPRFLGLADANAY